MKFNKTLLIITLLVGTFCTVLNQTLLATALPTLMKEFSVTAATIQWLTTGFLLVNGIMIPVTGWMMNRFNTKYLYIFSLSIFLCGTILCFLANTFSMLLMGRLVQAIGVGVSMPLLQNVLLSIFPKEKRGSAMGIAGVVIGLAPAIGPTLSGWVIDQYSWRDLFGMIIPITIVVIIMAFFFMKPVLKTTNPSLDILSVCLSTIGFGTLLYGFSSVSSKGWSSPSVLIFILIGIIAIVIFSRRQFTLETPFLNLNVFRFSDFSIACILVGVTNMAMISVETVLPMYLQEIRGETPFYSGLTLLPGAVLMGVMNPITGRIFDKHGAKMLAIVGMIILTVANIPFVFFSEQTAMPIIIGLYALRLFAIAMVMMPVTTSGMNALPNDIISYGTAVNSTIRQVASSLGTAVMISVMSSVTTKNMPAESLQQSDAKAYQAQLITAKLDGYHGAFFVAVVFSIIALLFAFKLSKKKTNQYGND